jgi:ABC-type microcin C transport system permease subunit YejE
MSPLTAFKLIEEYAIKHFKGDVIKAAIYMNESINKLIDSEREALIIYNEWRERLNHWLEYIK